MDSAEAARIAAANSQAVATRVAGSEQCGAVRRRHEAGVLAGASMAGRLEAELQSKIRESALSGYRCAGIDTSDDRTLVEQVLEKLRGLGFDVDLQEQKFASTGTGAFYSLGHHEWSRFQIIARWR